MPNKYTETYINLVNATKISTSECEMTALYSRQIPLGVCFAVYLGVNCHACCMLEGGGGGEIIALQVCLIPRRKRKKKDTRLSR